jgi:F0F1-type ATP synthase assembly protein I
MDPEEPAGRALGAGYKYVSIGMTFAGAIVVFMGLGWLLDRWLGTLPLFLVAGALGGALLSFIWVYQKLKQDEARYDAEHPRGASRRTGHPPERGAE